MGGAEDDSINSPFSMKLAQIKGVERLGSTWKGIVQSFYVWGCIVLGEDTKVKVMLWKLTQ